MQQGACSMEYISGTFLRVKGDQKAQVLYYAGLWIQFRIRTIIYILNIQSKTFARIHLIILTNWVGVVNPAVWLIKIGLIFCTLMMQKKTLQIKISSNCALLIIQCNFTSHSAYDAASTKYNGVKIDGFLYPNFM